MKKWFQQLSKIRSTYPFLLFILVCCSHCDSKEQQNKWAEKEALLQRKEDSLLLKEKTLQLREEALVKREEALDSAQVKDSSYQVYPALVGQWETRMTCTETTCPGSAVGDTKTEQWDISYQENTLVAKAMSKDQLVRIYTGFYTGNTVELVDNRTSDSIQTPSKMIVRLRLVDSLHLEGQREILRDNDCRILYALQMEKQL